MGNLFKKFTSLFHFSKPKASSDYDASSTSRRMRTWGVSTSGPNTAIANSGGSIKSRSQKLRNDNPWVSNGIESKVANIIGRGITPRWKTGDAQLDADLRELWEESMEEIDADGVLDFYGLQALATASLIESGEVLGQVIYKSRRSDLLVPIKLKLLDPDFLPTDKTELLSGGSKIKMGIEFNSQNERTAYHLYKSHPNESFISDVDNVMTIRVPSRDICHIFKPLRPGQIRGLPWLTTIITRTYQLDEYEDAELRRKATAAMFAAFVKHPEGDLDTIDIPSEETTYESEDYLSLEPGLVQDLGTNEDITFSNPADVGETYEVWIKQQLRAVAAGMGITYEQLTGDLAGVTYTSIRAGLIEFRRRCRMTQRNIIVHQFCRKFAAIWLKVAVLNGAVRIGDYWQNRRRYRTLWDADGWDFTDPVKDLKGIQLAIRQGLTSRSQSVGERGSNAELLDAEIQEDNIRADKLGLIFDSDPRRTTQGGAKQKEEV